MRSRRLFLVLSGGGVNGVGQIGALMELGEQGFFQNRDETFIVGTSVGAFNGLGVMLGLNSTEYAELIQKTDFTKFLQTDSMLGTVERLFGRLGSYSARYIRELVNEIVKKKTGLIDPTFEELYEYDKSKHLFAISANMSRKGILAIFSHQHTPKVKFADGIHASMAVPLLYRSVRFRKGEQGQLIKDMKGDHFIDGGVIDNFMLHFFDSERYVEMDETSKQLIYEYGYNPQTVGICLANNKHEITWMKESKEPPSDRFSSVFHYSRTMIDIYLLRQKNEMMREPGNAERTIFVDTFDHLPFNFDIDKETKEKLLASGRAAAKEYLQNIKTNPLVPRPLRQPSILSRL